MGLLGWNGSWRLSRRPSNSSEEETRAERVSEWLKSTLLTGAANPAKHEPVWAVRVPTEHPGCAAMHTLCLEVQCGDSWRQCQPRTQDGLCTVTREPRREQLPQLRWVEGEARTCQAQERSVFAQGHPARPAEPCQASRALPGPVPPQLLALAQRLQQQQEGVTATLPQPLQVPSPEEALSSVVQMTGQER